MDFIILLMPSLFAIALIFRAPLVGIRGIRLSFTPSESRAEIKL